MTDATERRPASASDAQRFFRVVTVAHELLDELHVRPLDYEGRAHLARLFDHVLTAAEEALPAPLGAELTVFAAEVDAKSVSDGELRIALAELVGWLDGTVMSTPLMVPVDPTADEEVSPP
jgi:hypothetical protein